MKGISSTYLLIFIFIGCYYHGTTQSYNFKKLTTSQGLSSNTIYSLIQDDLGFIWTGTKSGLNRFDGYSFKAFPIPDSTNSNLSNPTVYSLLKDSNNLIWVGLKDGGLLAYYQSSNKFIRFPFDKNNTVDWKTISVKSIFEDSRNWLWIGTFGGGAIVLNEERKVIYHFCTYCEADKNELLSNDFVFDFQEDEYGNVYIATAGKGLNLFKYNSKSIEEIHANNKEDMNSFSKSLCLDSTNILWIGTEGNGLYKYDIKSKNWTNYRSNGYANEISNNIITDIKLDKNGKIWIATDGGGLNYFNRTNNSFEHFQYDYSQPNALNTNALYHLFFDKSDNLWIGTFNGGINILNNIGRPFFSNRNYDDEKKLGLRSVLAIREDENNKVWLGTDGGGIFYFDATADELILHDASKLLNQGQFDDVITSIQPEGNRGFWYGSFTKGLHFFDFQKRMINSFVEDEKDSTSIVHNNVWDLEIDNNGGLWIGTLGGGIDFLPKGKMTFKHLTNVNNLLSDVQIIDILLDRKNEFLWIATEDRGLNRLNTITNEVEKYQYNSNSENNLKSNNLNALYEDKLGNIWIISDKGIDRYNSKTHKINSVEINYKYNLGIIKSIVEDPNGYFWISTSNGIYRMNPKNYKVIEFGTEPGSKNNLFNPKASFLLGNGNIIFGSVNGFSIVTPKQVELNTNEANPVFSDLKLSKRSIKIGENNGRTILNKNLNEEGAEVRLSHKDREISFTISSTEYTDPERNKYAYKLIGYENDWNFVNATNRTITYTSLDGGSYQLQIKAANSSGKWSDKIRQLNIIVEPPFWRKLWFIITIVLVIISIVLLIYRFLLNRQKETFKRKTLEQEQEILKQEQQILHLKNKNLKKEVTNKKAELNASILQVAHKNEFLTILKDRIKNIQAKSDESAKKPLRSIVNIINSELRQEDYWEKFQLIFNETFQNFINQLEKEHPNLTQNDYRLSCFIKMKLNNREIASILNITLNGVEQAKYRLKKKIKLSKSENLNTYIQQFGPENIL